MAYTITLVNQFQQFGRISVDIVLVDGAGVLPPARFTCKYPMGTVFNAAFRAAERDRLTKVVRRQLIEARRDRNIQDLLDSRADAVTAAYQPVQVAIASERVQAESDIAAL